MPYLAGIIITFFLAIILSSKKGKSTADNVLAAWLCVIGIHLFLFYSHITNEIYDHHYLLGIQIPMPLLHGPLLYIYTRTVTTDVGFSKTYWLHFLPAAVAYAILAEFFFLPAEEKEIVYKNQGAGYEAVTGSILIAIIISGFAYVLLSFYELKKYRKKITDEFSNTERINLNWMRYLIYGILVIWLIVLLNGNDPLIFSAVVVFVSLLGYFGIKHMGIFTYRQVIVKEVVKAARNEITTVNSNIKSGGLVEETQTEMDVEDKPTTGNETASSDNQSPYTQGPVKVKYEKSGLQKEAADRIHRELDRLMLSEKIFKKEELSLAQLAEMLDVHPNNLSQVINTYESKNFYDYINTLRVEEFKTLVLLPENDRFTILSLAFECGFNSKTAFNRNFKKITGLSPSEYLKEMNVHLVSEY